MSDKQLVIRLNLDALNALFPEGSDVRVQLQNNVLTQAAKQYVKGPLNDGVEKYLKTLVAESFTKDSWGGSIDVRTNSPVAASITQRVRNEFSDLQEKFIQEVVKKRSDELMAVLDERIERAFNAAVIARGNKMIQERVQAALDSAVQNLSTNNVSALGE